MADEIIIETTSQQVIEVSSPGPQGPAGAAGTGLETLTTRGDTLYRGTSTGERLPIGTTGQILRVSASGVPEWGAAPASGVSSVNGETGAVTLDAADVGAAATNHSHQPAAIYCDAVDVADTTLSSGEPNGIYFRDGSDNGKAIYKSAQGYALWWDEGEEEWVLGNVPQTAKYYIGTGDTDYPWQATSWALGPQGSGDTPVVDQALLSNFQRNAAQDAVSARTPKTGNASSTEVVLGSDTRLSNSRTPTAHKNSHSVGQSDALAASDIGAQSIFDTLSSSIPISGSLQLSAARARSVTIENDRGEARDVYLPMTGIQAGDVFVIIGGATLNTTVTVKVPAAGGAAIIDPENTPSGSPVVISATGQQYRFIVTNPANFNPWRFVAVDTHTHAASAITSGTLDIARLPTGTGSTQVALGNHTHELTSLAATGATNGHVLTANGSGGVTFSAASGGGSGTKTYAVFTATDNQPPSTAFATLDTRNSIAVLDFDAATDENAVFVGIMPEAASLGSGLIVRLHWMATTATSGNVRWGVQFERSNTDLDADSFDTAVEATAAANGTSGILTTTAITVTTIDGITAGDMFRLKVFRNADDATNDTMTGDAELVAVEVRSAA